MKKLLTYLLSALMVLGLLAPALAQAQTSDVAAPLTGGNTDARLAPAGSTLASSPSGSNGTFQKQQDDIGCTSITSGMGMAVCTANIVYFITVGVGSWVANIAAYVFDYAVYISLSSAAYALDFIAVGWSVVRDVANMAFLFILLYIGIKTLLNAETAGTIRLLVGVVVVALLVNFSFVMTRIVIDAGNIVAVQFYNTIAAGSQGTVPSTSGGVPVRDITATIMSALNPQALIGGTGAAAGTFKNFVSDQSNSPMYYLIVSSVVFILTGITLWMIAAMFVFVAVKFIIRVVGLWFVIIGAPAAFIAAIFRQKNENKWFKLWLGYLIKFSFYPAVFLFMFYIQIRFMLELNNAQLFNNLLQSTSAGQSFTMIVQAAANVGVRLGFIMATMYLSLKVADWTVGEFSQASHWLQDKISNGLVRTARWGRLGITGLGYATAPIRAATQPMSDVVTRSGVNSTLWRGLNRVAGGVNTATPRQYTPAGVLDSFRKQPRAQGQQPQQGQQAQAQQGQQAQQAGQTQGAGQQARIEPKVPDYTGTAPEPRVRLPGSRGAIPGARIEPVIPIGQAPEVSAQRVIPMNLSAQRAIQSINKQDVHAAAAVLTLAKEPDMSRSGGQQARAAQTQGAASTQDVAQIKEQISGLGQTVRQAVSAMQSKQPMPERVVVQTVATPQGLKPVSVQGMSEVDLNRLSDKLGKKLGPKLAASLPHDRGPGGSGPAPAAPAQARPAPQTSTDVLGSEGMKA